MNAETKAIVQNMKQFSIYILNGSGIVQQVQNVCFAFTQRLTL